MKEQHRPGISEYRGHQEGLPRTPEIQTEVNRLFRDSGLAARVFNSLSAYAVRYINYRDLTHDVSRCNFGVMRKPRIIENYQRDPDQMETSIVIEFPNPEFVGNEYRISMRFQAQADKGFGYKRRDVGWERVDGRPDFIDDERPLTKKQMEVVEQVLKLQEAEKAAVTQA